MRILFAAFLALSACATATAPEPVEVGAIFDPDEVAWFTAQGNNTIHGNAVMRTVGGDVRTCAGLDANLVPVSNYADARFAKMYGVGATSGYLPARSGFSFGSTDARYQKLSRTIRCDSQGNFTFSSVPDGEYYVTALVTWGAPTAYGTAVQGGYLMQKVRVAGGETKSIVLTAT